MGNLPVKAQTAAYLLSIYYLLLQESEALLQRGLSAYGSSSRHVFVVAYRGGRENDRSDMAPGDSLANISNAVEKDFYIYESDIEILSDQTLVVFHDAWFNDLTNCDSVPGCDSDQTIPTLEKFLRAIKGRIMVKLDH